MKTIFKDKIVHQAGYHYNGNWVVVGRGDTLEEAKAELKKKLNGRDSDYFRHNRYEESTYTNTARMQEELS